VDVATIGKTFARYKRPFAIGGTPCLVTVRAGMYGLASELRVAGEPVAADLTPATGPEAVRNHLLHGTLPDGTRFEVEAGYLNWWNVGIAVRQDGRLVHESHPGRRIAMPESAARMARDPGVDMDSYQRNKVPIAVDIGLGLLFFAVASLTDLPTAAIVGAVAGLALIVAQRFVKVDLIGGLAMFGVLMLLISAGLAIAFQDDMAVKMRTTIVGVISAAFFLGDGLLGGKWLGRGLMRYLPYKDIDPARLAIALGLVGLTMAGLNYGVAIVASTRLWLFYSTFLDIALAMGLFLLAIRFARGGGAPPAAA
jgi:intracellular septation protein A